MRAVDLESQLRPNSPGGCYPLPYLSALSPFHGALLLEPPSGTVDLFIVMGGTEVLRSYGKGSLVI